MREALRVLSMQRGARAEPVAGRASMLTVLPLAGLPCDARDEVGPSNSLRGCAAALKQIGPAR